MPLIIRSNKLYFQPLVYTTYTHVGTGRCPGWVGIELQKQFEAPDDERYAVRNILSLQEILE
jgi:hypothetical protein